MEIINPTPLLFAPLAGQVHPPRPSVTLVVKGSFALEHDGVARLLEEQPPFSGDVLAGEELNSECLYPGDLEPWKPRADQILVGTCHAPGGRPARSPGTGLKSSSLP